MSFPFFHWALTGDTSGLSICWWVMGDCDGLETPGGRGRGWTLALLPSSHASEWDLLYECKEAFICFLVFKHEFCDVGLWSGEWSGLHMILGDNIWEGEPGILSWGEASKADEACNGELKRSKVLNLCGLRTGLEKPLLGALLAGKLRLKSYRTPSTLSSLENPRRR